jgi:hypothetical protein
MTRVALLLSLASFMLTIVPAVGADKFECPSPFKPNTPAKLEQINGLLPNANAMSNINQLSDTIATLRRDGMSKRLMIDHLIGAYCPMVVRDASLTEAEKDARVTRFSGQVTQLVYSLEVVWTSSSTCPSRLTLSMRSTALPKSKALRVPPGSR